MKESFNVANWMKYPSMFQFYKQSLTEEIDLEPDIKFLSEPSLGRYPEYRLKNLEIPENIRNFLVKVGLPDQFIDWRSPDEEEDFKKEVTNGIIFWLSCLTIKQIAKKKYLIIGESKNLNRSCIICNYRQPDENKIWEKSESCTLILVELKTGTIWQCIYKDTLIFVNSSLEQYLLSMAYWRAFYPSFTQKIHTFLQEHPDKIEEDYIFKHQKTLYKPFIKRLKALDPKAVQKRTSYWKFMCDLTLY